MTADDATSQEAIRSGSLRNDEPTDSTCHEPPKRLHAAQNRSSLSRPGIPVSGTSTWVADVESTVRSDWSGSVWDGLVADEMGDGSTSDPGPVASMSRVAVSAGGAT